MLETVSAFLLLQIWTSLFIPLSQNNFYAPEKKPFENIVEKGKKMLVTTMSSTLLGRQV